MTSQAHTIRVVQAGFILYAAGILCLMIFRHPSVLHGPSFPFLLSVTAIALIYPIIGYILRAAILKKSRSMDTPYERRLMAWYSGNIVGFLFSVSTCLFGYLLHMVGARGRWAESLFGLGIVLLVAQRPGKAPERQAA